MNFIRSIFKVLLLLNFPWFVKFKIQNQSVKTTQQNLTASQKLEKPINLKTDQKNKSVFNKVPKRLPFSFMTSLTYSHHKNKLKQQTFPFIWLPHSFDDEKYVTLIGSNKKQHNQTMILTNKLHLLIFVFISS